MPLFIFSLLIFIVALLIYFRSRKEIQFHQDLSYQYQQAFLILLKHIINHQDLELTNDLQSKLKKEGIDIV